MSNFAEWLADIEAQPTNWIAPIIRSGDLKLALEVLKKNPELLRLRPSANNTLLQEAAYFGHQEIADSLLALGATMDVVSATALNRTELLRSMLDADPHLLQKHSPSGLALLHIASRNAATDTVLLLLSYRVNVNDDRNRARCSPLFYASLANAQILLSSGAFVDARAKHGFTPLHRAAQAGDLERTRFLIAPGASANLQTEARQTAFALAVRGRHRGVVEFLKSSVS